MEFPGAIFEARIRLAQVGEPLGNGGEGITYCASPDRATLLPALSVSEGEDKQVGESFFR